MKKTIALLFSLLYFFLLSACTEDKKISFPPTENISQIEITESHGNSLKRITQADKISDLVENMDRVKICSQKLNRQWKSHRGSCRMICDETNNYKGELSMAQKQSNTNLSTLLFSFMNRWCKFTVGIKWAEVPMT